VSRVTLPRLFGWSCTLGLFALGIYLLLPSRNLFGNPGDERELRRCILQDGAVIRLYEGNGGATTAYWYTVTHAKGWREPERQIFYVYGYPEIRAIACRPDTVLLTLSDRAGETLKLLPMARIRGELRGRPVALSRGEKLEGRGMRPLKTGLGTFLLSIGLVLRLALRRAARKES
jgi:hypothetical protein